MKALILVGGYGTRLRPLTLSVPKPLIHFCNRPMVEYQIRAAVEVGVRHIILAVAYQPDAMKEALEKLERKYNVKISCSVEHEPLMTAGPIRLAKDLLFQDDPDEDHPELFFTFNSDIICEFPLRDLIDFHLTHGKEGTICVTEVAEPSHFGVVLYEPTTRVVQKFVEKPQDWIGNEINGGLYLLDRKMIDRIEPRPVSIEREIFPAMARDSQLCCFNLPGYWADIGKPKDFLEGTRLYLGALRAAEPGLLASGPEFEGNVLVHPSAVIEADCKIGPNVTIGPGCHVGRGCRLSGVALMANVQLNDFIKIDNTIVGWNSRIGKWVRIEGLTVLGEDVTIYSEQLIRGAFVLPNKEIKESVLTPGTIIM